MSRSWVAVLGVALIVVSEYRFTAGRSLQAALNGSADTGNAIELLVYALSAVFLLLAVSQPPRGRRSPLPLVAMWAFTFAMILVSIWSPYASLALVRSVQLVIVAWFAQLIADHAGRSQLWYLCHAYVAVITVSAVSGLAFHDPGLGQEGRYTWLYLHPNISGALLGVSGVVTLGCLLRARNTREVPLWPMWVYYGAFLVNLLAMIGTQSRGSIAGLVAGLVVVAWNASRRRSRLDLAIMSTAALGIVWLLASGDILRYLARGESSQQLSTLNSRTGVWEQGLQLFWQRPIFGHGFMSSRGAFIETFGLGGAHNALIEVMVNSGAFGSFFLLAVLVTTGAAAARLSARRDPDGPVIFGILIYLVVSGLAAGELAQAASVQNIWLFVIAGWTVVCSRDRRAPQVPGPSNRPLPGARTMSGRGRLPLDPGDGDPLEPARR